MQSYTSRGNCWKNRTGKSLDVTGLERLVVDWANCLAKAFLDRSASHGVFTSFGAASKRYLVFPWLISLSYEVTEVRREVTDDFAILEYSELEDETDTKLWPDESRGGMRSRSLPRCLLLKVSILPLRFPTLHVVRVEKWKGEGRGSHTLQRTRPFPGAGWLACPRILPPKRGS
jgi:hypothetical protein